MRNDDRASLVVPGGILLTGASVRAELVQENGRFDEFMIERPD
ncbi:MAG: hypothetical protein WA705_16855 [Candidatus Ozemobacteraceae bacterium]